MPQVEGHDAIQHVLRIEADRARTQRSRGGSASAALRDEKGRARTSLDLPHAQEVLWKHPHDRSALSKVNPVRRVPPCQPTMRRLPVLSASQLALKRPASQTRSRTRRNTTRRDRPDPLSASSRRRWLEHAVVLCAGAGVVRQVVKEAVERVCEPEEEEEMKNVELAVRATLGTSAAA